MAQPPQASSFPAPAPGATYPWWFLRLYRHPAAVLALLLTIPLVTVSLWVYVVNERQWRAQEGQDLLVAAHLAARIIEEELTRTREAADAFAGRPAVRDAIRRRDRAALAAPLHLLLDLTPAIDRVMVTDAASQPLVEAPAPSAGAPPSAPVDPPHPDGAEPVSGVYLRDEASGEKVVGIPSAVRDDQGLLGTLQLRYRLQHLSRWLEKVRIEPAGFLYVADRRGFLVAHPFQLLPGTPKNVSGWPPVASEMSAQGRLIRFRQGRSAHPWTAAVSGRSGPESRTTKRRR